MQKKKKIGLYFGSFNPVHNGHLAVANYFLEFSDLDKIWFVVSPQNPLKNKKSLLADYHRLEIMIRAIDYTENYHASNIEFKLPKPSYTIDTLIHLKEKYPTKNFVLLMGGDNIITLHKWKNYEQIVKNHEIYVYPRPNSNLDDYIKKYNCKIVNAPQMEISSSFIRASIKDGKKIKFFMPVKSYEYILEMNFYKK